MASTSYYRFPVSIIINATFNINKNKGIDFLKNSLGDLLNKYGTYTNEFIREVEKFSQENAEDALIILEYLSEKNSNIKNESFSLFINIYVQLMNTNNSYKPLIENLIAEQQNKKGRNIEVVAAELMYYNTLGVEEHEDIVNKLIIELEALM